jgi:hypothetical protein
MTTNNTYDVVEDYVLKHPDLNYTEIADLVQSDGASNLSHRSLRRYAAQANLVKNIKSVDPDKVGDNDDFKFVDASIPIIVHTVKALVPKKRVPKILLLDIETARMIIGAWRLGKQRIGPTQVIKDWFILGWGAKWLFHPDIMSDFVTSDEAIRRDDKRISASLWDMVNEADVVIAHNGNKFDIPKIMTRFLVNGLQPPMPFLSLDTYRIATKQFGFSSNALDFLAKLMFNKGKADTDYQLWIDCENGDQAALDYMEMYCKGDVGLLEEVYVELRPWIKSHPNLAVMMNADVQTCPNCGGTTFETITGYYTTPQNEYNSVRCSSCGAVNRKKTSNITTEQRKVALVPVAR